jgi:hypothetical protein
MHTFSWTSHAASGPQVRPVAQALQRRLFSGCRFMYGYPYACCDRVTCCLHVLLLGRLLHYVCLVLNVWPANLDLIGYLLE